MSDTTEIITGHHANKMTLVNHAPCRVAYTLNNMQPVACTIIGNQPMFYMDLEEDYADTSFLDEQEIALLEKEVTKLKREIDEFDRFTDFINQDEDVKFYNLLDNSACLSASAPESSEFSQTSFIAQITSILEKSRTAKAYLDFASQHNVSIKSSEQILHAEYDRKAGVILINPSTDMNDAVLLVARELRRHWQHRHGALVNPLLFQPDNAVLINRLQIADLTTSIVKTAWELQLSGHREIWERLENSPMADLARAFAHEAFLDFRTINNGVAGAAVIEAWFLSDRCKAEDKALIQQMLVDAQGYVFDNSEAMRSVTAELIGALGTMPYGKNYLANHTMTILDDPIFNDVRDRSNANFLWFIKFERSFRETEHELQNGESSSGHSSGNSKTINSGSHHATPQKAAILSFEPRQNNDGSASEQGVFRTASSKKTRAKNAASGENIVYLRKWSGE
jgi:hypothetical protein